VKRTVVLLVVLLSTPLAFAGSPPLNLLVTPRIAVAIPPDANGQQAAALIEASASERAVLTGTVTAGG